MAYMGKESKRVDVCVRITDSLCLYTWNEHTIVSQLYSNKHKINNTYTQSKKFHVALKENEVFEGEGKQL